MQTKETKDRIAVVKWFANDGIAEAIHHELARLGYQTSFFYSDSEIPGDCDIALFFAPYGKFSPLSLARNVLNI